MLQLIFLMLAYLSYLFLMLARSLPFDHADVLSRALAPSFSLSLPVICFASLYSLMLSLGSLMHGPHAMLLILNVQTQICPDTLLPLQ
eukprot:SAG11_NODE_5303_length_1602_cov_1.145709_3_plen_87_part_01